MPQLVLAVYHDRDQALAAVDALQAAGVPGSSIGFLATRPERFGQLHDPNVVESSRQPTSLRAGKGPFADPDDTWEHPGPRTPGWGLQNLTEYHFPHLGPVLAAGPMTDALDHAPKRLDERAVTDLLERRGVDTARARVVAQLFERGGIVLTVHGAERSHAGAVLSRYGPVELQG